MTRRSPAARTALLLAGLAAGWVGCGRSGSGAGVSGADAAVAGHTDSGADAPAAAPSEPDARADAGDRGAWDGAGATGEPDAIASADAIVDGETVDADAVGGHDAGSDAAAADAGGGDDVMSDASDAAIDDGVSKDPVARGSYLVRAVLACGSCHSPLPAAGAAPDPSLFLSGRDCFATIAIPTGGTTCLGAPNLTPGPMGIGRYSDAQLTALIFDGVRPDGARLLAGYMPAYQFRLLSDDDAASVVAYLRSLPPVARYVASRDSSIPAGAAAPLSLADVPAAPAAAGAAGERGRFLAAVACVACHSPRVTTVDVRPIKVSGAFTGGRMYVGLDRDVYASNLTTVHPEGPGAHVESIVRALRTGVGRDGLPLCARMPGGLGAAYAQLSDDDAHAIATYLASLPPAGDVVQRTCVAP